MILFFVATGIQVVFFLLYLIAFSKTPRPRADSDHNTPISVIVCAHNEEKNLRELVPMLLEQQYPEYEVVVVVDRSDDHSYDFLLATSGKDSRLRFVTIDHTPERMNAKKYALTLGIKTAKNPIILLTDADCRPASPRWIHAMTAGFDDKTQFVLGYSPYYKSSGLLGLFIRFETLLTGMQYIGMALLGMPYMGVGRNLAYRRSLFMENKGFNDLMEVTGGDDDLFVNRHARRHNTRVSLGNEALMYSVPKMTWRSFLRQKVRHLSAGKRYRAQHKVMSALFNLSYIVSWGVGISLLALSPDFYWPVGVILLGRSFVMGYIAWRAAKRLGDSVELWPFVILDFVYVFYYISTGLRALITKKVRWTN